ncbi:hypothetical protein HZH68_001948 [Vespula germanica]|uniref:Uncharacterized protein n=1 Tax=Vespula germanica TaxID=30212 RepID=A0A834KYI0_VESGE|nr:hypothetical protein HZH68_001948 [Vespula germanica]
MRVEKDTIAFRGTRLEVITEIDGHRSDPSWSLYEDSECWFPSRDLLDTRYMGYRYGCYRRSSQRYNFVAPTPPTLPGTTGLPAATVGSINTRDAYHPSQIRMAHLTL